MAFVIGVDGGGSKTTCVVADMGFVIGSATGAGSNFVRLGDEVATRNLEAVIGDLCFETGVAPGQIEAIYLGLAGAATLEVQSRVQAAVQAMLPHAIVHVDTDVAIALEAALGPSPGIVVISGTGSIAYGRNDRGETARAGGLGPATSDEGSGYWIGREVVNALLQDGSSSSSLVGSILTQWNLTSRQKLECLVQDGTSAKFAELFPLLLRAKSDPIIKNVLLQAGEELGRLASEVIQRLMEPAIPVRVCIAGGVFASSAEVRRSFYQKLRSLRPNAAVCFRIADPVQGAVELARQLARAKQVSR